jgi:hypothetical protein
MPIRKALGFVVGFMIAFASIGQEARGPLSGHTPRAPMPPKEAPDFGPVDNSFIRITSQEFTTYFGDAYHNGAALTRYSSFSNLEAGIHVPGGALVTYLEFDYCDTNASNHMTLDLLECDNQGQGCTGITPGPLASANGGCSFIRYTNLAITIDNYHNQYVLDVTFGATDGTNLLAGAIVGYQLQVSPAPGSATFNDVPTSDGAFQFIEAFNAAGITVGCSTSPPLFCPDNFVTRRQMAVYFAKALGLHWSFH